MTRGLGCSLALIIAISLVTAGGCGLVASRIADYGKEREATKQVEIRASAAVDIARINAGVAVDVARINADAAKKTSMAYVAFYALRAILWAGGLVWALVGGAWLHKWAVRR